MMPRNGAVARSEQLGTLSKLVHTMFVDARARPAARRGPAPWAEEQGYDSLEASLVRVTRRDYEKLVRVPPELSAELSRTSAIAEPVWQEARKESDWAKFQPYLEKVIDLRRQYVDCFEPADEDYDHLLDIYEPGMKTAEVRAVFDELKAGLVPLIAEVAERADAVDDSFLIRRVSDRRPEARRGQDPRRLRLHSRFLAARRDRASLRHALGHGRHPADDEAP